MLTRPHAPTNATKAITETLVTGAGLPVVSPLQTLAFAEHMASVTRTRRAAQLAAGQIDQAKHDVDVAAAVELLRLAQDVLIFDTLPLN